MKKIILITLMGISLIGFSLTNKEIIEQGGVRQKQTFDKYFNGNTGNTRRDPNLLNRVYPEIVLGLYNRNKQTFDNEITRLGKMKDGRKNILKPLLPSFNEYINENSVFTKNFLKNFLEEKDDFQSYIYTATSISLENFYLNMNTLLEAEKNESSLEENVDTVMDYLYHSGDEKTKEDYVKMSNSELDRLVSNEFAKLNAEIDKKMYSGSSRARSNGNSVKSSLRKTEKLYSKYQENFDAYINSSRLKAESKEKIKKMIRFEKLSDLKFLIQSLKTPEVEKNEQQQQ